jgi:hypothetical protein
MRQWLPDFVPDISVIYCGLRRAFILHHCIDKYAVSLLGAAYEEPGRKAGSYVCLLTSDSCSGGGLIVSRIVVTGF